MMSPAAAARKRHRSGGDGGEGGDVALAVASGGSQAVSRTLGSGAATIVGCDMDGSARAGGVVEQEVVRPNGTTGGLALAVLSDRPAAVVEEYAATRTGSLHQKKRQRLVQRAATRPSEDVMAQAPAGMADIGAAPKLSEFKELASTSAEQRELHAVAFHEWMKKNISKTGIQQETRVRVMYRLNTRTWRWLRSCDAKTHARLTFYSLYIMTDGVWHVRACAGQVLADGRDLRRLGGALGVGDYCRVADELGLPWARARRCAGRHECDRSADADVRDDHEFFARGALPVGGGWLG